MTVSNNWVNALRADEAEELKKADAVIALHRVSIAQNQRVRRAIIDRARKRLAKGVDKDSRSA